MKQRRLMVYYGDDFTGSTDALEALTINGAKTVLFTAPPDPKVIDERFQDVQCIGIAGTSRAMNRSQLGEELTNVFQKVHALDCSVIHYKICSTGDSSPDYGSVGKAIEVGRTFFSEHSVTPLLVGVPRLGRFTVFANHFAVAGGEIFRLDRHPVMSTHPVTPMVEADLRKHFAEQTTLPIDTLYVTQLDMALDEVERLYGLKMERDGILVFDTLNDEHLSIIGQLWWESACDYPLFVVGSSGVQYALISQWRKEGLIPEKQPPFLPPRSVEKTVILSGSCSAITHQQIRWALDNGFMGIPVNMPDVMDNSRSVAAFQAAFQAASRYLHENQSVIIYSSLDSTGDSKKRTGSVAETGITLGKFLGNLAKALIATCGVQRLAFAGGDTSGYATQQLGITALEMIYPTAKGAPLCKCYADDPSLDGIELALKGGQLGQIDYFGRILHGI